MRVNSPGAGGAGDAACLAVGGAGSPMGTGGADDWNMRVNSPGTGGAGDAAGLAAGGAGSPMGCGGADGWNMRVNSPGAGGAGDAGGAGRAGSPMGCGGAEPWNNRVNSPGADAAGGTGVAGADSGSLDGVGAGMRHTPTLANASGAFFARGADGGCASIAIRFRSARPPSGSVTAYGMPWLSPTSSRSGRCDTRSRSKRSAWSLACPPTNKNTVTGRPVEIWRALNTLTPSSFSRSSNSYFWWKSMRAPLIHNGTSAPTVQRDGLVSH
jgi:hypothetical protein